MGHFIYIHNNHNKRVAVKKAILVPHIEIYLAHTHRNVPFIPGWFTVFSISHLRNIVLCYPEGRAS